MPANPGLPPVFGCQMNKLSAQPGGEQGASATPGPAVFIESFGCQMNNLVYCLSITINIIKAGRERKKDPERICDGSVSEIGEEAQECT